MLSYVEFQPITACYQKECVTRIMLSSL